MSGKSQWTIGPMIRELRWLESVSLENEKMTNIHTTTGNQYFKNERIETTTHQSKVVWREATLILIPIANRARLWQ
jgi:hypothetical protein